MQHDNTNILDTMSAWLAEDDLTNVRAKVPMVYVEAVPVRVDHLGSIERVGLLLRATDTGTLSRAIVSGRVQYGESIRDALWRHLAKDLGPDCDPRLPVSPSPMTVAEYFPDGRSGFYDARQHAVSMVFVVPIQGQAKPTQNAIDLSWLTPQEALSPQIMSEMAGGQHKLVSMALGFGGIAL